LKEQTACWIVANKVKTILQKKFNPDGFNIGININEYAGQTISHCHIHIIPRYKGDVENPSGGIRGVIPSKKEY
jgi:diadenosine tetraphosphate (Ap4A) HIT family hydrolase